MGKRSGKYHKKNQDKNGSKKVKGEWKCQTIPDDNPFFREYYKIQLGLLQEDFNQFWSIMKLKLPVVFRVNPNCANHNAFCRKVQDQQFIKSIVSLDQIQKKEKTQADQPKVEYEPQEMPKPQLIDWYPGKIVYTINTNKQEFKKSKILSEFHKFLQKSFDSGLISRQQLVSMLPPLYLNVKPDDIVLDLCAAPGSKTSQILQMIYGQRRWLAKGCVVANDADYSRAQMLIHQLHRSGTTGMAVINHAGQFLPELYTNKVGSVRQKFQFDKILCDVPCSGDGTTRKLPIKWLNWHTSDGMVLHPLQLSILMKAINLLKKGGYLVYSTCSLNPIENEAVVNALFQKVAKGLQLVDIHPMYGVKGRRGLLQWKVIGISDGYEKKIKIDVQEQQGEGGEVKSEKKEKKLKQYETFEEVKNLSKMKISMFPPTLQEAKKINLDYTMRILPHDQNSGGFYVALLRKTQDFEWSYSSNQKKKLEEKGQAQLERQFLESNLPVIDEPIASEPEQEKMGLRKQQEAQEAQERQGQQDEESEDNQQIPGDKQKQKQGDQDKKVKFEIGVKDKENNEKKKSRGSKFQTYSHLNHQDFENIQKFYGLPDIFKKLLYIRSNEGQNASKKVLLVSEGVHRFLEADVEKKIKLVNMGCQVFEKGKQSFAGNECLYRLCQDGIHFILDYLQQRKIRVTIEFFKKAITIKSMNHQQIVDEQIRQQIKQMTQGSFCIYIQQQINGVQVVDALVGQNFKNSFHLMVSKQDQASLHIRYL